MLTLKQNRAGTVLIGGGWPAMPDEGGRPRVSGPSLTANLGAALRVVPALRRLRLVRSWAAAVNGNASWKPLLGAVPGIPGFFINYVPWMGFSGGPAGAEIVASLVQGREPPVDFDLRPFMLD
jgi:glycine/D-amino acid oxidase-like deaminating enzyme